MAWTLPRTRETNRRIRCGGGCGEPVNPNAVEINVEAALADPDSVLRHYRKLIALRHELAVVALGDFTMLLEQDPRVYAFTRSLDGVTLLVLGNFSSEQTPMDLADAAEWAGAELLLGNYPPPAAPPALVLRPWESRIYRRGEAGPGATGTWRTGHR